MQRLLHELLLFLAADDDGSGTSVDCNHGARNATTGTCDCASGWTTDWTNLDVLGGSIVYCNSQASTPAPGNTTAATTVKSSARRTYLIVIAVGIVALAAVLVALGFLCFCCCRRRRRNAEKREQQHRLEETEQQRQQQQCRLEELKRRQREEEAEWNREAMLRRQMWDTPTPWHLRSDDAAMEELWSGSFAAATSNSQFPSNRAPFESSVTTPRRSREGVDFPVFNCPCAMAWTTLPSVRHYQAATADLSSNLYTSDSTACTTSSGECIYTQSSESPPPALAAAVVVKGASPFTTPRNVEPYDPNNY